MAKQKAQYGREWTMNKSGSKAGQSDQTAGKQKAARCPRH